MSILTVTPSPEWYEAPDIEDDGDDTVPTPELMTVAAGIGWWTNTSLLPDLD